MSNVGVVGFVCVTLVLDAGHDVEQTVSSNERLLGCLTLECAMDNCTVRLPTIAIGNLPCRAKLG